MIAFCRDEGVPHEICGKLVVATNELERTRLADLHRRGEANGLNGLRRMAPNEFRKIEPEVAGVEALHVPEEGIVDYARVVAAMVQRVKDLDVQIRCGVTVGALHASGERWVAESSGEEYQADYVVNCAGLHCDRVARSSGHDPGVRIIPFRGEYFRLKSGRESLVRHLIYPVPDPQYPFLGVHFTRMIGGGVECGPNAVLALAREGYSRRDVAIRDIWETFTYSGFWRFLGQHRSHAVREVRCSLSRAAFTHALQRLVPVVTEADLEEGGSGVRAQAMTPMGELVQDFFLVRKQRVLHVLNAPSPAATASLSIGEYIADQVTF